MKVLYFCLAVMLFCGQLLCQKKIVGHLCQDDTPVVDGILDEPCWQAAQVVDDFIQREPDQGRPCTERTEARVVFSKKDLYIGIVAFDSSAKGPQRYMARRDSSVPSDWLTVWIDSLGDKRTAFQFSVNPSGVKQDIYWYDEERTDANWDPVWDVAVRIAPDRWIAEFRIPLSQLRFPVKEKHSWGFQIERIIARNQEKSYWAPVPRGMPRFVSLFGTLLLDADLPSPRKLLLIPYAMGQVRLFPEDKSDPFFKSVDPSINAGLDAKYGLSSNFTFDLTVNPDFGQVESDPSFINLSAHEVFLPEKRPFFVEGSNIYGFSLSGNGGGGYGDMLFYSRRIGRSPQGIPWDAGYSDIRTSTPIAFALKLTGKTESGWSVGLLQALSIQVKGDWQGATGDMNRGPVEPLTNYSIVRVQKDFRQGRSALGGIVTFVGRSIQAERLDFLSKTAWAGGVDFRHRWSHDTYEISGEMVGSSVAGSREAILRLQESPARYFQRPDNDRVRYDPTRTSLSGSSFRFSLAKIDGAHWLWSIGTNAYSPGFEVNDLGFLNEADTLNLYAGVSYRDLKPNRLYRELNVGVNAVRMYTFAADSVGWAFHSSSWLTLRNYWGVDLEMHRMASFISWATLRGGPLIRMPGSWNLSTRVNTDSRRPLFFSLNAGAELGDEELQRISLGLGLTLRLRKNLSLEIGPNYAAGHNPLQYIATEATANPHYVFARIDQKTFSLTLRFNYALSPVLTLQLYAQPFVSNGRYTRFKEVNRPLAAEFRERWHEYGEGEIRRNPDGYAIQYRGDSFVLADPDFAFRQFRLNLVLRWEYRPGSSIFVVWTQGRNPNSLSGRSGLWNDLRDLFDTRSDNIFLVKFTYWLPI